MTYYFDNFGIKILLKRTSHFLHQEKMYIEILTIESTYYSLLTVLYVSLDFRSICCSVAMDDSTRLLVY